MKKHPKPRRKLKVPYEINTHYHMFGMEDYEAEALYTKDKCPICDKRYDMNDYCACGGHGG